MPIEHTIFRKGVVGDSSPKKHHTTVYSITHVLCKASKPNCSVVRISNTEFRSFADYARGGCPASVKRFRRYVLTARERATSPDSDRWRRSSRITDSSRNDKPLTSPSFGHDTMCKRYLAASRGFRLNNNAPGPEEIGRGSAIMLCKWYVTVFRCSVSVLFYAMRTTHRKPSRSNKLLRLTDGRLSRALCNASCGARGVIISRRNRSAIHFSAQIKAYRGVINNPLHAREHHNLAVHRLVVLSRLIANTRTATVRCTRYAKESWYPYFIPLQRRPA